MKTTLDVLREEHSQSLRELIDKLVAEHLEGLPERERRRIERKVRERLRNEE